MNLKRVAKKFSLAIESIESIERGDATAEESSALQWRVQESLAEVKAELNRATIRDPGQLLARRLVTDECDRLVSRCRRAVMGGE